MHSFCLPIEKVLITNCTMLYFHSNDMNSLKKIFEKVCS